MFADLDSVLGKQVQRMREYYQVLSRRLLDVHIVNLMVLLIGLLVV